MLKAADMITSPAYVVIKAANEFKDKPSRINEQWQTVRKAGVYAILPTSKLKDGAGIIYPPFLMTTADM